MSERSQYYLDKEIMLATKLDNIKKKLPDFANGYLDSKGKAQTSTLLAYAQDLMTFFQFLHDKNPVIAKKEIAQITLDDMKMITARDINEYTQYLGLSLNDSKYSNHKTSIARKFAPLNGLFVFYIKQQELTFNPVSAVDVPQEAKDKTKKRLKKDDVEDILQVVTHDNETYSDRKKKFKDYNRLRDYTIIKLMLDTGIRISECVGLDISSINFKRREITIIRKGGGLDELNISEQTAEMLLDYIRDYRNFVCPKPGHEEALFYSLQGKRISVSSVEKMVKEYGSLAVPGVKFTPHKFRAAYGTELYSITGDIALVADVLGHNSIETTKRHYTDTRKENKRKAAEIGPVF